MGKINKNGTSTPISISQFKARALRLIAQVAETGNELTITKRGKVIARILPPEVLSVPSLSAGKLRDSVIFEGDITSPVDPKDWSALK
jgi:prevent-host-death family protein